MSQHQVGLPALQMPKEEVKIRWALRPFVLLHLDLICADVIMFLKYIRGGGDGVHNAYIINYVNNQLNHQQHNIEFPPKIHFKELKIVEFSSKGGGGELVVFPLKNRL